MKLSLLLILVFSGFILCFLMKFLCASVGFCVRFIFSKTKRLRIGAFGSVLKA